MRRYLREGFYPNTDEGDDQREEDIKKADATLERFFEKELDGSPSVISYNGFEYDNIYLTIMGCDINLKRKLGKVGKKIDFEVTFDFDSCGLGSAVAIGRVLNELWKATNKGELDEILKFIDERELKY